MSESYFSRFFRKATGNRFSDFVNRIRISKACELLAHSDQYITTICYDVGFNNVANFNRRFFDHKQVTPSDYRKQARERYELLPCNKTPARQRRFTHYPREVLL
jgi:AraC-like DNA-binding protein